MKNKKMKPKRQLREVCVIWICRNCGAYNLDPVDWTNFECILCGANYLALASPQFEEKKNE